MKKINLATDDYQAKPPSKVSTSTIIGSALLLISFSVLGFLYWERQSIAKEKELVQSQIEQKQKMLEQTNFKEIYDFESRLISLDEQMQTYINPVQSLSKIASATFPENYFTSLIIDSNSGQDLIKGEIVAPDYSTLANQMNYFIEEGGFSNNFILSRASYKEGGVSANVSFDVKDYSK
jgi:hypothetical protein